MPSAEKAMEQMEIRMKNFKNSRGFLMIDTNLFGFLLDVDDFGIPFVQMGSHELIYLW